MSTLQLDLPLLLPGVADDQDACVARLAGLLEGRAGIERVHIAHVHDGAIVEHEIGAHPAGLPHGAASLCIHYDAEQVTLSQLNELAKEAGASVTDRYAHELIRFRVVGAEDSGRRIESELRRMKGVTSATANFAEQAVRVEFDVTQVRLPAIEARLRELDAPAGSGRRSWYARNRALAWSLIAGGLTLAGWLAGMIDGVPRPATLGILIVAYYFGARDNVGHLIKDLRKGHFHFNIDLLMVVAAMGAASLGAWVEGALLLFLFSLGHALQHYAMGRARHAISALAELAPQTAVIRRDGVDHTVPIADVRVCDLAVVKPGERFAIDGVVREGTSAVNQAPITGESVPVEKAPSDKVFAGSVNGEGVLLVEVSTAVGDRTLDRVIKLVTEAGTQKAPTQQFTDRFQKVFVPAVLLSVIAVILLPPLIGFWSWSVAFYRAMALVVAASPCALALGTPAAVLSGIAQAARNGVLIKGGAHLEALGAIEVLALDKTGTITRGEPEVTDVIASDGTDRARLLTVAAAVERQSQHPIARAIVRASHAETLPLLPADGAQSVTGKGIRANVEGHVTEVGKLSMFAEPGLPPSFIVDAVQKLEVAGRTTMVVRSIGNVPEWLGVIGVADEPRDNVRATLDDLRSAGIKHIVMLTGDNAGVAAAVAKRVGLDEVRASLMPEDKVTAIKELAARGSVAMVGDGVNDAPALAHATVGIAMGGAGTAVALETADVALMGDDLSKLPFAIGLSREARAVIRQNLFVSLGVIVLLVIATLGGFTRIGPAVVAHEGSTLVVVLNALRLLRYRRAG